MKRLHESSQEKLLERKEKGIPGNDSFEVPAIRRPDHPMVFKG
ncbi:MAG: hypothetical protein JETT_1671 [Candidatus Jettenia ecosi]|uniref:Uncharacterized protein n=1 Tax=Candidatus Jettenia ecosi TaxID=2494326 RepID=A0A533QBK5_9BACT|nr:MAG: hypothetical protein JETT_1671 [Candidatus Jettenia ecosi]